MEDELASITTALEDNATPLPRHYRTTPWRRAKRLASIAGGVMGTAVGVVFVWGQAVLVASCLVNETEYLQAQKELKCAQLFKYAPTAADTLAVSSGPYDCWQFLP
jgi:hypothetical protein